MTRAPSILAAFALLALLSPPRAHARCEQDAGCARLDSLTAAPGASPFAAVGTSDVLSPLDAGFGLQLSGAHNSIAVLAPRTGAEGERLTLVERQVTASWLFALGLGAGLELGFAFDSVVDARGPGLAAVAAGPSLRRTAVGDARTQLRWAVRERPRTPAEGTVGEGLGVAVTGALTLPIGMSGAFASEHGVMFQPTVTTDFVRDRFRGAIDVGARIRGSHPLFDATWGSQLLAATGATYEVTQTPRALAVGLETWVLSSLDDSRTTADVLATLSSAPAWAGELLLVAGAGRSFAVAGPDLAAPPLRYTFAVRYAPRDVDRDGDGLVDKNDPCPSEAGPTRDTETPGCPDRAPQDLTQSGGDATPPRAVEAAESARSAAPLAPSSAPETIPLPCPSEAADGEASRVGPPAPVAAPGSDHAAAQLPPAGRPCATEKVPRAPAPSPPPPAAEPAGEAR